MVKLKSIHYIHKITNIAKLSEKVVVAIFTGSEKIKTVSLLFFNVRIFPLYQCHAALSEGLGDNSFACLLVIFL